MNSMRHKMAGKTNDKVMNIDIVKEVAYDLLAKQDFVPARCRGVARLKT